jgi:penicillin-binding protein 1C
MKRSICALSGMRPSPWCPAQTEEWIAADDGEADRPCTWHTPAPGGVVVHWPPEYVAWARAERLLGRVVPAPRAARAAIVRPTPAVPVPTVALRVVNPPDGAVYLIDPTLRREFQTLALRVATAEASNIEWRVDGRPVGRGAADAPVDWPLAVGSHVVTARDARGREAGAAIVVK